MFYNVRSLIYDIFFHSILIERHRIMSYLNRKEHNTKQTNKTKKKTRKKKHAL